MNGVRVEFDKAQYRPGDDVNLLVWPGGVSLSGEREGASSGDATLSITITVSHLADPFYEASVDLRPVDLAGDAPVQITIPASALARHLEWHDRALKAKGFGLDVEVRVGGVTIARASRGFDVAEHWRYAPRYGFVSEFGPSQDEAALLEKWRVMKDFHLNAVQFYDWMYRHYEFIPPESVFTDPLGRLLDLRSVRRQVELAHGFGIRPIAYGAVYAAEKEFADLRPEWLAYTRDGSVHSLADLFFIADISKGSPWVDHIIREFRRAMDEIGFSGIHADQYGFPRTYYRGTGDRVRTAHEFAEFIGECRARLGPSADLIFNCVNNWPVREVAQAPQDAVYIEVWSPHDTYRDLHDLIAAARCASAFSKQVILAAYLAPFKPVSRATAEQAKQAEQVEQAEAAMRLAAAAIMASGGFHLVLGEGASVLTEGYYPNFGKLRPEFTEIIKRYWDFAVRYEEFLFDLDGTDVSDIESGGPDSSVVIQGYPYGPGAVPGTLWTIIREGREYKVLHLVNLLGANDAYWNAPKTQPKTATDVRVRWLIDEEIRGLFFVTPDVEKLAPERLHYTEIPGPRGRAVEFVLPQVDYWSTVLVELG